MSRARFLEAAKLAVTVNLGRRCGYTACVSGFKLKKAMLLPNFLERLFVEAVKFGNYSIDTCADSCLPIGVRQ